MDPVQTMPDLKVMLVEETTNRNWLNYYRNTWVRNLVARVLDVRFDTALKAKDPETMVENEGRQMSVKVRLEHRKIYVQDALDLITRIDEMLAMSDDEIAATYNAEALAVAEDMKPEAEEKVEPKEEADKPAAPAEDEAKPSDEAKV